MKLLRLKITDPKGFRSLQPGFEHFFRTEWQLEDELKQPRGLAPFVCAGPNGSGKSNLLEALAAIFFQLEILRVRRSFLPEAFFYDEETNPEGLKDGHGIPDAFELEYLIRVPYSEDGIAPGFMSAHVVITKMSGHSPEIKWLNPPDEVGYDSGDVTFEMRGQLLPQFVLGYSSGENEILSLPFFKMRFIQYDGYWDSLKRQQRYDDYQEPRLAYLDYSLSQAIVLCNMLFNDPTTTRILREDVGVSELLEFRIIIRQALEISHLPAIVKDARHFVNGSDDSPVNPALIRGEASGDYRINMTYFLAADVESSLKSRRVIDRLKRCASCHFTDPKPNTLYLDYHVNEATRQAFSDNFDFQVNKSPIALFQAFQVLLSLNHYSVTDTLKAELYRSDSQYVNETVPTLASDKRIMRFKFVKFTKEGVEEPVMLKSLSDGEHQLLHSLGLCLLFKNTNSLFLLDEPETHFNPEWRSSFISRLRECFADADDTHEMLITTHSPFLISDSKPDRVLEFEKKDGKVHVKPPEYNTFGASINKITLTTFDKRETIGAVAQKELARLKAQVIPGTSSKALIDEIYRTMGDSVERTLLIKSILDQAEETP